MTEASPPAAPVDALGVYHRPVTEPARIVSLVPSITELLFDLGLGDQVVGRTTFCIHPSDGVAGVAKVGGTKKVRIDKLRELAASHVIVNVDENTRSEVEEIATFVPHVVVTHPIDPHDNLALFRLLGRLFHSERTERLCDAFDAAYRQLCDADSALPPRRVLYLIWRKPWMTVSRDTYISRMLALVNWHTTNHDAAVRYPEVTLSPDTASEVDLILLSSEPFPFKASHRDEVSALVGEAGCDIDLIDAEMVSWYGSRAIPGLHYLSKRARELSGRRSG